MASEETYELCLPILQDKDLEEEDKVEKLEDLLRQKASLSGSTLENVVLDVLWRYRNSTRPNASPPPVRHTIIRRTSPAPWQIPQVSTPVSSSSNLGSSSPAAPPGLSLSRGGLHRPPLSGAASPFTSPRPSPRLALAQPIPHSPSLHTYEFSEQGPTPDIYGDYGSDNVDWLVNDDAASQTSSIGGLSGAAPEWLPAPDMSPHDILRSVLGDRRTNEEIEQALETHGYDLAATIAALTETDNGEVNSGNVNEGRVLVGKSMTVDQVRPTTPSNNQRGSVVCKYWLSTGQCLRADCRFSHDLTSHVCKYWLAGNCLAGDSCPFSHDPSSLVGNLSINGSAVYSSPAGQQAAFQLQNDYDAFPALQSAAPEQWAYDQNYASQFNQKSQQYHGAASGLRSRNGGSRPTSRHQQRDLNPAAPSVDDPEAFPTLSSLNSKGGKKHQTKRGGQSRDSNLNKENSLSSLADVIRSSPSPAPNQRKAGAKSGKNVSGSREISAAAQAIPSPKHIPWLETGARINQQYMKYRADAICHGTVRNKFLQSAAQAWHRNDARAAKALSLRGQAENEAMRKCHREAARHLYDERNSHLGNTNSGDELYIDLHGLHPEEAVEYLSTLLMRHAKLGCRVLYAITGTGHHSKNGKDKVGKTIKSWLNELRYVYREFSVPGERGGYVGGVLGIDPTSYDKNLLAAKEDENKDSDVASKPGPTMGKIQLLKREDVEKE